MHDTAPGHAPGTPEIQLAPPRSGAVPQRQPACPPVPGPAASSGPPSRPPSPSPGSPGCPGSPPPAAAQAPPGPEHRLLRGDDSWRHVPAYADVDARTFHDPRWQEQHTVTGPAELAAALGDLLPPGLLADVEAGCAAGRFGLRLSPHLLSLIDWREARDDPIRRQFVPLGSERLPDHPRLGQDAMVEDVETPVPGLLHGHPDRVLFLVAPVCPVPCRCCTRPAAAGLRPAPAAPPRWAAAFEHIAALPCIEHVHVGGGDPCRFDPALLTRLCDNLLAIEHVRSICISIGGAALLAQRVLGDAAWTDALTRAVERGRSLQKEFSLQTHFNSAAEMSSATRAAMTLLRARGVPVRNLTVLQRGVNDSVESMLMLVRRLSFLGVQPHRVKLHDPAAGAEHLRTTLQTARDLEKHVRGVTRDADTPLFVVDLPGAGRRDVHSFEHYDPSTGVAVFTAPGVRQEARFCHLDPIDLLPAEGRTRWADRRQHAHIFSAALIAAGRPR